jgi:dolichol-phosphate mannosyltransferase
LKKFTPCSASGLEFEVVYVDDGSSDATAQVLREAMARYPRLRVMSHRHSCGQSAALFTGVRAARGAWIATLDGDGQNDPADLPMLLAARTAPGRPANLQLLTGYRRSRRDVGQKGSRPGSRTRSARASSATRRPTPGAA